MRCIWLVIFLFLTACATVPVADFESYRTAFNNANEQTQKLLDIYNQIEKFSNRSELSETSLNPDHAYLLVDSADAPRTRYLREGFQFIADYNIILGHYATGDSLATIEPELQRIQSSAATIGTALDIAEFEPTVQGLLTGVQALARIAVAADNAERFRASLLTNQSTVDMFLARARAHSEAMFSEAVTYHNVSVTEGANRAKADEELEAFRVSTATWVLVIDETRRNLDVLTEALNEGRPGATLAQVARSSERVAQLAEEMRIAQQIFESIF